MKLILEFDSVEEHDAYIQQRASGREVNIEQETGYAPPILPVTKRKKRRPWTEYELEVIRRHWPTKTTQWIAASLQRTPGAVHVMVAKMRKAGAQLATKRKVQKAINTEAA
jgi:hypothetical protein